MYPLEKSRINGRIYFRFLKDELVKKSSESSSRSLYLPLISHVLKQNLQSSLFIRPCPIDDSVFHSTNVRRVAIDCTFPSYKSNPVSCRSISLSKINPQRGPPHLPPVPFQYSRRQFLQHFAVKFKLNCSKYLPVPRRFFFFFFEIFSTR